MASILKNDVKTAIIDFDLQGSLYKSRANSEIPIFNKDEIKNIKNLNLDFVFIDTPPYLTEELPNLCKLADAILIPTKTGIYDLLAIKDTINIIKQVDKEDKTLIVFNMEKPNTTLTTEMQEAIENYNITVAETKISDLVAFTRSAMNRGVEDSKKAQQQMESLTREILSKI